MSEIKVGDMVEVLSATPGERAMGIIVGDIHVVVVVERNDRVWFKNKDDKLVKTWAQNVRKIASRTESHKTKDAPTVESSKIKVGDWVEVIEVGKFNDLINVGDVCKVVCNRLVGKKGAVIVNRNNSSSHVLYPNQIKKVDAPETLGDSGVESTVENREINAGDWVELTVLGEEDSRVGIKPHSPYQVVKVGIVEEGAMDVCVVTIDVRGLGLWHLYSDQVEKVDAPSVNEERPASTHYQNANNNDVWQFADDNLSEERVKGFHQVNAIKYVTRYHIKHDTMEKRIEDLEKAKVSIDKLIELERQSWE